MNQHKLRFAVFGNEYQVKKSESIQQVVAILKRLGAEVYIERSFYEFLSHSNALHFNADGVFNHFDIEADFVVSMGGDGTFLNAACMVGPKGTPIVGVNTGRLGFLADISPEYIEPALQEIVQGRYRIEQHSVIQIETDGGKALGSPFALNDIAVLKRDNASMIAIHTSINGQYLVTYQADGLIVSTPTGSTAYSLSNGGPIMVPQDGTLCLTPVAPHSLSIRPIVVPDDSVITLTVESRSHNFLAAIDGRSEKMEEGTNITIRKAPYYVHIVKRPDHRFFNTLRQKLMWGVDVR